MRGWYAAASPVARAMTREGKEGAGYTRSMASVQRVELAYNNVYAIERGGSTILIDTGPDYAGAWDHLSDAISRAPELVIATHGHHDHAGLGHAWQAHGIPVALHRDDFHMAAGPSLATEQAYEGMLRFID